MNPTMDPTSLMQDQVLAHAEAISADLMTLFESEDPEEDNKLSQYETD
jgi:hypothetical protein